MRADADDEQPALWSGLSVSLAVESLFPSKLSLLVELEDALDELFADVEIGGLELFDDFRKVDEVECCGLIENVESADDGEATLLGNVAAVTFVDEEPVRLEFFGEGDSSGFAGIEVQCGVDRRRLLEVKRGVTESLCKFAT